MRYNKRDNCNLNPIRRFPFWSLALSLAFGCMEGTPKGGRETFIGSRDKAAPVAKSEVVEFCGACHAYPDPKTFPREMWREEVLQGYRFFAQAQRDFQNGTDNWPSIDGSFVEQEPPDKEGVIAYYEANAPELFQVDAPRSHPPAAVRFREELVRKPKAVPAVSHIAIRKTRKDDPFPTLFVADMRSSDVSSLRIAPEGREIESLGRVSHPAHVDVADLNGDGRDDWIVSDLG
ncbi:MAG: VCBS repeat-containing protein, partial [Planctomycetaceae bacterium]|nr:VCBS repeat-containing protein [Planctomycetaceae bacterium]